jgi:hypothetical protein
MQPKFQLSGGGFGSGCIMVLIKVMIAETMYILYLNQKPGLLKGIHMNLGKQE